MTTLPHTFSLTQSPLRNCSVSGSPTKPRDGSFSQLATSRLRLVEMMEKCHSLQRDVGLSLRTIESGLSSNLSTFTQVRKELDSPPKSRWNSSVRYREVKERIQKKEQQAKDLHLGSQISALKSLVATEATPRDLKLVVRKTKVYRGKKAREVEEPVHVTANMLGTFMMTAKLVKDPRGFGERAFTSRDLKRDAECEELNEYWKTEIGKYEKQRNDRLFGEESPTKPRRQSSLQPEDKPPADKSGDLGLSPLQLFVHTYNSRKLPGDDHISTLRRRMEAKMQSIQPSSDVVALSQKYLPKHLKQHSRIASVSLVKPSKALPLTQRPALDTPEEDFLKEDIRREMTDTNKLLNIEAIMSSFKRREKTKRKLIF